MIKYHADIRVFVVCLRLVLRDSYLVVFFDDQGKSKQTENSALRKYHQQKLQYSIFLQ